MAENQNKEQEVSQTDLQNMLGGKATFMEDNGFDINLYVNDRTNPVPMYVLDMFYRGVISNKVGIAVCKHKDTGNEALVLVGVEETPNGDQLYPLAVALQTEEAANYLAPDGQGGYVGYERNDT